MPTADLPAPPTTAAMDLAGMPAFQLDTERLLASELWVLSNGEEFKAAVGLWCRSWKQSPPGSLPNDDRVLAGFSGAGRRWPRVREMALRGFVACSDGRLYHMVLCEDAIRAWGKRTAYRDRAADAAAARWGKPRPCLGDASSIPQAMHGDAQLQVQGDIQGEWSPPSPSAPPRECAAATAASKIITAYDPPRMLAAINARDLLAVVACAGGNIDRGPEWTREAAGQRLGTIAAILDWRLVDGDPIREPSGLRAALLAWKRQPADWRRAYTRDFAASIGLPVLSAGADARAEGAA